MVVFSKFLNFQYLYAMNMDSSTFIVYNFPSISYIGAVVICLASLYFFCSYNREAKDVPIRDVSKDHSWRAIQVSSRPWYCSICELLLINGIGAYCDCCGVCADPECIKKANKTLICKVITSKSDRHLHHWVKGNLPLGATCSICMEECMDFGLADYQCCWCQRAVHTKCLPAVEKECDFGPYKSMIVPPWCVQTARMKSSIHRHLLLRGVKDPGWEDWSPLIVVANRKSGNNDGGTILSEFRKILNPAQVIDLAERPPAAALQWSVLVAPKPIRLLVAGGDGTVSWMLTTSYKMDLEPPPAVSILPLGTGNDLSRVLGWGKENSTDLDAVSIMKKIDEAKLSDIDRWRVDITPPKHLGIQLPAKTHFMYNYFSVGVDAQVALDFHKTRDSKFYLFSNRIFNKILYLIFGTHQVMWSDCKNIEQHLDLYLDGKKVELPELESVVVLNIPSWGAGVDLWSMSGDSTTQSYKDGVLEVLGIYSSFHIAQLQVGLSTPHRIGQAKNVEIQLKATSPVQVDGEPWEQHPANIKISIVDQATVLVNRKRSSGHSSASSPLKINSK
ncbi:PREDICTED: diacylglycerol kinase epsilon [Nicrophorus vespilloides]|uniref:Diacylglycerol kinase n=1 Tax=Nicrophorus vespilloides TaxID=110193 RepID=A0ABM1MAF1_NICVS|nr:PREDICTED: diacylglycerol kinase epsilon [Nicrophorus vespilloides]